MTNLTKIPSHIAFILDGNRRWAKAHELPTFEGHRRGYEQFKEIAKTCFDRGIKYVTGFIFSTENWNRSTEEVKYLMDLALKMFKRDLRELEERDIRVRVLGFRDNLRKSIIKAINEAEANTINNKRGQLNICFNYGGQQEITEAVRKIVNAGIPASKIDQETIKANLFTYETPPPDLIVRTSGEQRLSNFLLWDSAYAELSFVPEFWPDFDVFKLDSVLKDFAARERRNGR